MGGQNNRISIVIPLTFKYILSTFPELAVWRSHFLTFIVIQGDESVFVGSESMNPVSATITLII